MKKVNVPQIIVIENGDAVTTSYDWQVFFRQHFRTLVGIKKIGYFCFTDRPGSVFFQETLADEETEFSLVWDVCSVLNDLPDLPDATPPPGLSHEGKQYLYKAIREFV